MITENATFKGKRISVDGGEFYACHFNTCTLIFNGLLPVAFDGCSFDNCSWEFSGPASNTIGFMTAMYAGGAKDLIENTFQNIRGQPAGPGPTLQ